MNRREFVKLGAVSAASLIAAPAVHAQEKRFSGVSLRMNGYGGNYDKAMMEGADKPLETQTGLKVEHFASGSAPDVVKLLANRGNPHLDLFMIDSPYMPELIAADIIEPILPADVPNLSKVLPAFLEFGDRGVPFSLATMIPVYNSSTIKEPLTSYSDIARPDLKGKCVTFATNSYTASLALLALAEENGGSLADLEPGYKVLRAAKANIVALANSTVSQLQMLRQGEAHAGHFWDSRATELRKTGTPVQTVIPKTGVYSVGSYLTIPRGSRQKAAALAYINQMLSDEGMLGLPRAMGLAPTTGVELGDLAPNIIFNSPERANLKKKVDWAGLMSQRGAINERINKELQG